VSAVAGAAIPEGSWTLQPHENWLGHDALYSVPAEEPHPLMAFVAAVRGAGLGVAELFRSWGTEMADGPMLTASTLELPGELRTGVEYRVSGTVESVVRKSGRTMGEFDLLTARLELRGPDGETVALVRNVYALPRGRGAS
jgi:hypothetical protein